MKNIVFIITVSVILFSCKKPSGEGGNGSISGTVFYEKYTPNGNLVSREEAKSEDVYIVYGENDFYDDDIKTGTTGNFEFLNLRKGDYTVYSYSDCDTCASEMNAQKVEVSLSSSKDNQSVEVNIVKNIDYSDGSSVVSGTVLAQNYLGDNAYLEPYPAQDIRVYISEVDADLYFASIRTNVNGYYEFDKITKGNFVISAYSQCSTCADTSEVEIGNVTVKAKGEMYVTPTITIKNQL